MSAKSETTPASRSDRNKPPAPAKSFSEAGTTDRQGGIFAVTARIFWMALGNFILMICAAHILTSQGKSSRTTDIIFWAAVIALIAVRFLDIKFLDGQTVTGEPASIKHWRRYAVLLIVISAAIWAGAHFFKS